jgi:hypothetical protein
MVWMTLGRETREVFPMISIPLVGCGSRDFILTAELIPKYAGRLSSVNKKHPTNEAKFQSQQRTIDVG